MRAVEARAEEPDGDAQARTGNRTDHLIRLGGTEVIEQLDHILRERILASLELPAECPCGGRPRPWRTAEAKVDPAGIERFERPELLGDHQWRVVRQHDAAGADADGGGSGGHVADDDRGGGARDPGHAVVLGEPEAAIAQALRVLREIEGAAERQRGVATFDDRREIEDGQRDHAIRTRAYETL